MAQAPTARPTEAPVSLVAPVPPFETQGERRRAQMVAIAAKLVVAAGVEAVSHATVAQHAGVGRTAVYRYFPERDDIFAAITSAYGALYSRDLSSEEVVAGVLALAKGTPKRMPPATRLLQEKLWDARDWSPDGLELRLATVILQRDPAFQASMNARHPELADRMGHELTEPLTHLGLNPVEVGIVTDALFAAQYHATAAALAGTIDREEAMRLSYRLSLAVVRAFLD